MTPNSIDNSAALLPELMTVELPTVIWIELTSKCPFDCVFCSRKTLRGAGEHMDFEMYQSLIGQLRSPEIIRLNYSGESAHYPRLLEAIHLAHATGAFTEMVSALASYPKDRIESLVMSGLDRLTVSLHTMDEQQFTSLYQFSSLTALRQILSALREGQRGINRTKPLLDFAFVALQENLGQLPAIAQYARELGVRSLFIHPVIRRVEIPARFDEELIGGGLRPQFKRNLSAALQDLAVRFPEVAVSLSTPELEPDGLLDHQPQRYAGPLPEGARIYSCDQNPWETVHILANGDVVVCEVQDQTPLGNLKQNSLAEIWNGDSYRHFRQRYWIGQQAGCKTCPYKVAHFPSPIELEIAASNGNNYQLLRGWHQNEDGIIWSKQSSQAVLAAEPNSRSFRMKGVLPPSIQDGINDLSIHCNGKLIGVVTNPTKEHAAFDVKMSLPGDALFLRFEFFTKHAYSPASIGGQDVRELGFALELMQVA